MTPASPHSVLPTADELEDLAGDARSDRLEEVTAVARQMAADIASAQAELVEVVHAADQLGPAQGMTMQRWLSWQLGMSTGEVRKLVGLSRRLPDLPLLSAAFSQGRLSEDSTLVLAEVATPENESKLVSLAEVATANQLKTLAARFKAQPEPPSEGESPRPKPTPKREDEFTSHFDDEGRYRFRGDVSATFGATFESALSAGFETAAKAVNHQENHQDGPPVTKADALLAMCHMALGSTHTAEGLLPERFRTIVHMDAEHLMGTDDARAHMARGGHLDSEVTDAILCSNTRPIARSTP